MIEEIIFNKMMV